MAEIAFDNVWKRYPDGFEAVKDMNLEIRDGEFMILESGARPGADVELSMDTTRLQLFDEKGARLQSAQLRVSRQ